jgi:hypothetical protein
MNRKTIIWLARFILSVVLLLVVYSRIDADQLLAGLAGLGGLAGLAYAFSWLGAMFLPAIAVWRLASSEKRIPLGRFVAINHVNRLIGLATPFIVAAGARFYQYVDVGLSKQHSLALLFINKLINVGISLLLIAALGLVLRRRAADGFIDTAIYLSAALLAAMILGIALAHRLARHFKDKPGSLGQRAVRVFDAARGLSPQRWALVTAVALLANLALAFCQWLLLYDAGQPIGFHEMLWARSVLAIVLMVPVSVAGLGFRDLTLVAALGLFGVAAHQAALLAVILLGFQVVHGLLGFVLEQISLFRPRRRD